MPGFKSGKYPMDLSLTAADLAFVLCGLIAMLGVLLIWAIRTADQWVILQRPANIRSNRERSGS
jgi:hypothetical protein